MPIYGHGRGLPHPMCSSLALIFSLSVCDITATEVSDTCQRHVVANGNPTKKGLIHWLETMLSVCDVTNYLILMVGVLRAI